MLVIQQQIAADLQPHKQCSIIADGTYDNRKREATVFVTGESHTSADLSVEGSSLRRVYICKVAASVCMCLCVCVCVPDFGKTSGPISMNLCMVHRGHRWT